MTSRIDLGKILQTLGPGFAHRIAEHDASDRFVAENYAELKSAKVFSALIPEELGAAARPMARCAHSSETWPAIAARRRSRSRCTSTLSRQPY